MKKFTLQLILLAFCFAQPAHANKEAGNGGGAYICPNPADSEILDIFEAKLPGSLSPSGLTIENKNEPMDVQISEAFAKLNPKSTLYQRMMGIYAQIRAAKVIPVPQGFDLAWPSDALNKYGKAGCYAKSIILFHDDDNSMDLDSAALNALPETQQAALWVHETVYKFLRETQAASDSIAARKVVGHLFSEESQNDLDIALGKIANFYPNAVTRLSQIHGVSEAWGIAGRSGFTYPASYQGEALPPLQVRIELDPSSDPGCADRTDFTEVDTLYATPLCIESEIDSINTTVNLFGGCPAAENQDDDATPPTLPRDPAYGENPEIVVSMRADFFWQKKLHCRPKLWLSDPFGHSYVMPLGSFQEPTPKSAMYSVLLGATFIQTFPSGL